MKKCAPLPEVRLLPPTARRTRASFFTRKDAKGTAKEFFSKFLSLFFLSQPSIFDIIKKVLLKS
jgi:hypothetical protein